MTSVKNKPVEIGTQLSAIVLAAGKGTRMASPLPKVLHPVAGLPMITYVLGALKNLGLVEIRVVLGHGQELIRRVVDSLGVGLFIQTEQKGTAHAVRSAGVDSLEGDVLIVNGDHPLITDKDLKNLYSEYKERKLDLAVISTVLKKPKQFGRIVRNGGSLVAIAEAKDCTPETLKIKEVNTGIYFVKAELLKDLLPQIKSQNSQGEFYLTDIVSLAIEQEYSVDAIRGPISVSFGVNSQVELAQATHIVFQRKNKELMDSGVIIIDPKTTFIDASVKIGPGSVIYPNTMIKGKTTLGSFVVIEPFCFVMDCEIADSCQVHSHSHLFSMKAATKVMMGPYARIREGVELSEGCDIGNFVELKKVKMGKKSKAKHLSYLGDAEIGEEVNIGCGTITCNYAVDRKKYKTVIGDRVFVGSDSQFVAPVTIGSDAVIGSGSTITKDVPAGGLGVARSKQFVKENYNPKKSSEA